MGKPQLPSLCDRFLRGHRIHNSSPVTKLSISLQTVLKPPPAPPNRKKGEGQAGVVVQAQERKGPTKRIRTRQLHGLRPLAGKAKSVTRKPRKPRWAVQKRMHKFRWRGGWFSFADVQGMAWLDAVEFQSGLMAESGRCKSPSACGGLCGT